MVRQSGASRARFCMVRAADSIEALSILDGIDRDDPDRIEELVLSAKRFAVVPSTEETPSCVRSLFRGFGAIDCVP